MTSELERLLELHHIHESGNDCGCNDDMTEKMWEEYEQLKDKINQALEIYNEIKKIGVTMSGEYIGKVVYGWVKNQHNDECRKATKELQTQIEVNTRLAETLTKNQTEYIHKETLLDKLQQAEQKLEKIRIFVGNFDFYPNTEDHDISKNWVKREIESILTEGKN